MKNIRNISAFITVIFLFISSQSEAQWNFWNILMGKKCSSGFVVYNNECVKSINLTVSQNSANYNIFSAAGSPNVKVFLTLTINSGISIYSNTTASPALTTGSGWISGSFIKIINNGGIYGMGGAGGAGSGLNNTQTVGLPGGTAINLNYSVTISNNGNIYGGGGGGAGAPLCTRANVLACGGGGSGGQGWAQSAGGAITACYAGSWYPSGTAGNPGNFNGPGASIGAASSGTYSNQWAGGICTSGTSGAGGTWGVKGGDSTASSFQSGGGTTYPGLSGGAAGRSILLNGNLITWENGNNAPQVKGPIQ